MITNGARWSADSSRRIKKRIIVECELILKTPACLCCREMDDVIDMPLLVDSYTGAAPLLTGTSITGALRHYLYDRLTNYGKDSKNANMVALLFGGERGVDDGQQSSLIVDDAIGTDPSIEYRYCNRIESATSTAADEAVFSTELWGVGTSFPLRFELLIRECEDIELEDIQKKLLVTALAGLEDDTIRLGARKSRGYGDFDVQNWKVRCLDFSKLKDVQAWIDDKPPIPINCKLSEAIGVAPYDDERKLLIISALFGVRKTLLIRSGDQVADPDNIHLARKKDDSGIGYEAIFPGTSFAGVLRAGCRKIGNSYNEYQSTEMVNSMFGYVSDRSKGGNGDARASRISITERTIVGSQMNLVQERNSIDRFSQATLDGALFSELPAIGGQVNVDICLQNPEDEQIGLLLLALKDLWTSDLAVGGETGVGRGRMYGISATISLNGNTCKITQGDGKLEGDTEHWKRLENCVTACADRLGIPTEDEQVDD